MENELYHYGVKGMKWGIRRTPAQLGHKKKNKTRGWSKDAKRANAIKKKSVKQMSNQELRDLNKRMQLEREYNQLNPNVVKRGLKATGTVVGAMGTVIALYNNSQNLIRIGQEVSKRLIRR